MTVTARFHPVDSRSAVAVQLACGCWASTGGAIDAVYSPPTSPAPGLEISCRRHNRQPVVTRPDMLEVIVSEVLDPTPPVVDAWR
jgi:hypothetical protein